MVIDVFKGDLVINREKGYQKAEIGFLSILSHGWYIIVSPDFPGMQDDTSDNPDTVTVGFHMLGYIIVNAWTTRGRHAELMDVLEHEIAHAFLRAAEVQGQTELNRALVQHMISPFIRDEVFELATACSKALNLPGWKLPRWVRKYTKGSPIQKELG